ncbi:MULTISPECIES: ThiF family adenylyltransferase [Methylomonas]|uniref:ThiF family adenylyltransferase n=1 Tax=Methylomonas TaxID=416 RepID=UPI0004B32E0E|nr:MULTISPECIES: ThiF family adenylyltransferase [Methylomonas]PKM13734.1 MAG: hypothetical protein CVV13_00630 [Gammaproteobacteria bacterium HGW-Gammaproteobacteria-3]QBC26572.1 hypothetical protein U737_06400 [Methylomonas sp. LW13]
MANDQLGAAFRLLTSKGFVSTGHRHGRRTFRGILNCSSLPISISLEISDWDFLVYPVIKILEYPSHLPALLPHLSSEGNLCYFAPGSIVLDRYNPATAIDQCLVQATDVLNKILEDSDYRIHDIQNEFLSHWLLDQGRIPWLVLKGTIDTTKVSTNYFILGDDDNRKAIISDDANEVEIIAGSLGFSKPKISKCKCWILHTEKFPTIPDNTLPKTVKELFEWLKSWDNILYVRFQNILEKEQEYLQYSFVTFAISSPVGWVGFGFDLDTITLLAAKKTAGKRGPKLYKQFLHGRGSGGNIFRVHITDISADFVHNRNLSFSDLKDKRIVLIGCGAIGGFLAQSLVRLGAGTGCRGELILIDPDTLAPDNLGRHVLGYSSLFKLKAVALRDELLKQFPLSRIFAEPINITKYSKLFASDLLIDATGEEAISEMLNASQIAKRPKAPPILHIWIVGNGEATQSLWVDSEKYGCFHCLRLPNTQNYREERYKILKAEPERGFIGCQAFTPYAVSASISAAALATDSIIDWIKGDPSPRFRTRAVENANIRQVKNQNISPLDGCVACRNV